MIGRRCFENPHLFVRHVVSCTTTPSKRLAIACGYLVDRIPGWSRRQESVSESDSQVLSPGSLGVRLGASGPVARFPRVILSEIFLTCGTDSDTT